MSNTLKTVRLFLASGPVIGPLHIKEDEAVAIRRKLSETYRSGAAFKEIQIVYQGADILTNTKDVAAFEMRDHVEEKKKGKSDD